MKSNTLHMRAHWLDIWGYRKVLKHLYWPRLSRDVVKYCTTCHTCQMTKKPNQCSQVALLIPIPAMEEPFNRVIIDCVGPLPKTKSGNKIPVNHILFFNRIPVSCTIKEHQGTQDSYSPDKIFTLVDLPKTIQCGQGSNEYSSKSRIN